MKKDFKHPELRQGEIFIGNFTETDFRDVGWRTKRMGSLAYDEDGNFIYQNNWLDHILPVFAQKSELDMAGVVV